MDARLVFLSHLPAEMAAEEKVVLTQAAAHLAGLACHLIVHGQDQTLLLTLQLPDAALVAAGSRTRHAACQGHPMWVVPRPQSLAPLLPANWAQQLDLARTWSPALCKAQVPLAVARVPWEMRAAAELDVSVWLPWAD